MFKQGKIIFFFLCFFFLLLISPQLLLQNTGGWSMQSLYKTYPFRNACWKKNMAVGIRIHRDWRDRNKFLHCNTDHYCIRRYLSRKLKNYKFSRPFSSPLHSILENVFSISSRTLWNVPNARFNLVFGRSILNHCHSISCFVTRFRQLQFKFVRHSSWARDIKINFVYWHSFSSNFNQNRLPDVKAAPITIAVFEWQNNEICLKNYELDPSIRNYSLSGRDEFQWQLTNLNDEFFNFIDKKRIRMTIWRNWTWNLNEVSFSRQNWIETWWNWMKNDENGRGNLYWRRNPVQA